jgi:hypothetical protein
LAINRKERGAVKTEVISECGVAKLQSLGAALPNLKSALLIA